MRESIFFSASCSQWWEPRYWVIWVVWFWEICFLMCAWSVGIAAGLCPDYTFPFVFVFLQAILVPLFVKFILMMLASYLHECHNWSSYPSFFFLFQNDVVRHCSEENLWNIWPYFRLAFKSTVIFSGNVKASTSCCNKFFNLHSAAGLAVLKLLVLSQWCFCPLVLGVSICRESTSWSSWLPELQAAHNYHPMLFHRLSLLW